MFEKVNPSHPDKVADRIAGAIVDLAYKREDNPRISVEVLIGHGTCTVIIESNQKFKLKEIYPIVKRISGIDKTENVYLFSVPQDEELAKNQKETIKCGDNGIFKGLPLTKEEKRLTRVADLLYFRFKSDGKYILDKNDYIVCQSNAKEKEIKDMFTCVKHKDLIINPLGEWTGGIDVDTGATNRKLGSDMGRSVTGGGLHGKDLSKADVSVNIYAFVKAQQYHRPVELYCAIGDTDVCGIPYRNIVEFAREYIKTIGGFEKFAEWGLIR